jgi:Alanyl-tRNA synthetase
VYAALYKEVERKALMDYAGETIAKGRSVVLLVDEQRDAFFVLGRSKDLALNCGALLKDVLQSFGGRGGGKPEFASGSAPLEVAEQALTTLKSKVFEHLVKV